MKLLFTSDLHLGRKLGRYDLIPDQRHMVDAIAGLLDDADGIIIAGDVYDRSQPPAEAVALFDRLLAAVSRKGKEAYIVAGNHDSAERLGVGRIPLGKSGIHIAAPPSSDPLCYTKCITCDEYGPLTVFLMPYIRPQDLWNNPEYPDMHPSAHAEAVEAVISRMGDAEGRSILVSHQFVMGAERTESEDAAVGTLDSIPSSLFRRFTFTALGHLHRAQSVQSPSIRYSGSPLAYSFGEKDDMKSVLLLTFDGNGLASAEAIPIEPLHRMEVRKGSFEEIVSSSPSDSFISVVLTDGCDVGERVAELYRIFSHLVSISYENARTRLTDEDMELLTRLDGTTPLMQVESFFEKQNGRIMSEEERGYIRLLLDEVEGGAS